MERRLHIQPDGHRTIIVDLDQHMGAKFAGLGWDAQGSKAGCKASHNGLARSGGRHP